MSLEKTEELRVQFRLSTLHKEAQSLTSGEDWQNYTEIGERHDKIRTAEKQEFNDQFDDRMSAARRKVINEAGSKTHDHPTPFGTDRLNPRLVDHKAQASVNQDHQRAMALIDKSEMRELEKLMERARERDRPKQPDREIKRDNDRGSLMERRQNQPTRS